MFELFDGETSFEQGFGLAIMVVWGTGKDSNGSFFAENIVRLLPKERERNEAPFCKISRTCFLAKNYSG